MYSASGSESTGSSVDISVFLFPVLSLITKSETSCVWDVPCCYRGSVSERPRIVFVCGYRYSIWWFSYHLTLQIRITSLFLKAIV
jgi:hypothetical protein